MDASLIFPHLGLERGQVVISDTPIEDLIKMFRKSASLKNFKNGSIDEIYVFKSVYDAEIE